MSGNSEEMTSEVKHDENPSLVFGYILLATLAVLWGGNWPAMKLAVSEVPPWTFRTGCLIGGGILLLLVGRLYGYSLKLERREIVPMILVSIFNVTGWQMFVAYGLTELEAGRAVIIAFTMPIWAALFAIFVLKEQMTTRLIIGLVIGTVAMAILIGPDLAGLARSPVGAMLMLAAAASWGAGTVGTKKVNWSSPVPTVTGWMILVGGIPVYIGMAVLEPWPDISAVSWPALGGWVYAIVVAMVYCHFAWYTIVRIFPATTAALGTLAIPVVGVMTSAYILGEAIGMRDILSLVLVTIALGVVLIQKPAK